MSEAPGPTELATTQLLPFLAAGGNEEAWRVFVVRYRPRILRWCRRLQGFEQLRIRPHVALDVAAGFRQQDCRGSGDSIPNSGRVGDARPGMQAPRQCDSALAHGRSLSSRTLAELAGRN